AVPEPAVLAADPVTLNALWSELAGADAAGAYQAIGRLTAVPRQAVPFLKKQLRPVKAARPEKIASLVANLDHANFAVREQATRELTLLDSEALPALRKALAGKASAESARRLKTMVEKMEAPNYSSDQIRLLR